MEVNSEKLEGFCFADFVYCRGISEHNPHNKRGTTVQKYSREVQHRGTEAWRCSIEVKGYRCKEA